MNEISGSVVFNNLNINALQKNSGVFIGDNYQPFWSSHYKSNYGLGSTYGKNIIYQPVNYVYDPDFIDHFSLNTVEKN